MVRAYIDWVRVESFRCVRQADIHLTPLHALIGPNDAGKSSLLHAIARGGGRPRFWSTALGAGWRPENEWVIDRYPRWDASRGALPEALRQKIHEMCNPRTILRLEPDELRAPVPLIPRGKPIWFASEKGRGLGALYDALLNRDRDAFIAIDQRFRELFPTIKALRLENADAHTKTMGLTLLDGTDVGPGEMSEGMLYWLAFAIIEHLAPQGMLLIEEPENGLHPSRIAQVMRILRDVSKRTQIIVATHSPLVINELQPEEVTIVTRTAERGTICTPMSETKNFAERSKIYALGELWLSYADGDFERELVGPATGAVKAG
jgi:predicted ATPase